MKCQKCGKNETNFHYSSNYNGSVTETHLCSECAAESGYDIGQMFDMELTGIIESLFTPGSSIGGFIPMAIPMISSNAMLPFTRTPRRGMIGQNENCTCGCGQNVLKNPDVKVDEHMSLRRELNAQMRAAVAAEEFEKAAELRDKLRALESAGAEQTNNSQETGRTEKCDTETTSQD